MLLDVVQGTQQSPQQRVIQTRLKNRGLKHHHRTPQEGNKKQVIPRQIPHPSPFFFPSRHSSCEYLDIVLFLFLFSLFIRP